MSTPRKKTSTNSAKSDKESAAGTGSTGSRMAMRNWRISTRLVSLLALPVAAATVLGAQAIQRSVDNIDQLDQMQLLTEMTRQATQLADALQTERDKSAGPLASGNVTKDDANVVAPRKATDEAMKHFQSASEDFDPNSGKLVGVHATILDIDRQLNQLAEIRNNAYKDDSNYARTVTQYDQLITSLLSLSQDMAQATSTPEMIQSTRALAAFSSAKEYASMERAIISAGLAHKGGPHLSTNDRQSGESDQQSEDSARERFQGIYGDGPQAAQQLTSGLDGGNDEIQSANAFANRVFQKDSGINSQKLSYLDWYDLDDSKIQEMSKVEQTLLSEMEQKSRQLRQDATEEGIINAALVLLVLGISLVGAFVVSRSMVRSLRRLQDTAQRVAQERLPELVKQLSDADPQDVDTSVESVGLHSRDEIGRVAAAFDDVHREAVRLASEQALLRGNVNAMFTNLSRRSQGLIQRQLSLISELESREADPDQLSSLFKLDHLATRMRRNGENLLVLAGEEPGRRWTRPVPLVDVLRAAASEVEQYERIELSSVPANEVAGRVVNDLVHLLAELLENATSFSSPQTKVKVTGHALPDGRVLVEIHDTGIGLSPEDLAAVNERLASPPTVDVSVSRRMGLFVVGRLSLRHGIRIQLRPSDSGGTTALVMLPVEVAQGGRKPAPPKTPGAEGPTGGGAPGARLAGLQPRGQVGGGRPTLQGRSGAPRGGPSERPGSFGSTSAGLPSRTPGAELTPPQRESASSGAAQDVSEGRLPTRDGRAGQNGPQPTVAPPTGAPRREGGQPQLPSRGVPAQLTGGTDPSVLPRRDDAARGEDARNIRNAQAAQGAEGSAFTGRPGTSWGARRDSGDDWPLASREEQDRPRGHDEPEDAGGFPRPRTGGPGDTAQFGRPDFDGPPPGGPHAPEPGAGRPGGQPVGPFGGPQAGPGSWGDPYGRPEQAVSGVDFASTDPSSTGSFPRPGNAPADPYARPRAPRADGPFGGPGEGDRAGADRPDASGRPTPDYDVFGAGGALAGQDRSANAPGGTGAYQAPGQGEGSGAEQGAGLFGGPARGGSHRAPGQGGSGQGGADPFGGPAPAAPTGGDRTPIFDTVESHWFQQPSGTDPGEPRLPRRGEASPDRSRQDAAYGAPQQAGDTGPGPLDEHAQGQEPWHASPNDERWRRAEQLRQPQAGGVTVSGLPRRVPRANLVAGTAQEQQAPDPSGPQVSRSPDDVRGRLTNLRRGIQQGRQAGGSASTGTHGVVDPSHQQER